MAEASPVQPPAEEGPLNCKFCDKKFNGIITYIDHVRCRDHYKMVNNSEKKSKAALLQKFKDMEDSKLDRNFFCPECGKNFSSWTNADEHFRSSQHIKRISENEMEFILYNMKPKIVVPTNHSLHHPLSNTLHATKANIGHKAKSSDNNQSEATKQTDDKTKDTKDKFRRESIKNSVLKRTKIQMGEEHPDGVEQSSTSETPKNNMGGSKLKEQAVKPRNAKVSSRKVNSKESKEHGFHNLDSKSEEIQANEVVRSSKGIAYFLPNDPIPSDAGFKQTASLNESSTAMKHPNRRAVAKKDLKARNCQEEINVPTPKKASVPETLKSVIKMTDYQEMERTLHDYSIIAPKQTEIKNQHKDTVLVKANRKQKQHLNHMEAENSSNQHDEAVMDSYGGFKKGYNQNSKSFTSTGATKKESKGRPRQSMDSADDYFVEIYTTPRSNKGKKSTNSLVSMDEMEKPKFVQPKQNNREDSRNKGKATKLAAVNSSTNNHRTLFNGQCEKCGHIPDVSILTSKEEEEWIKVSKIATHSSKVTTVIDKRKLRKFNGSKRGINS